MAKKGPGGNEALRRRARVEAAAAAQRKHDSRRRVLIALGAGVLIVALVGGLLVNRGGDDESAVNTTKASSTDFSDLTPSSTEPAAPSAAGKPCVAVSEELPPGAPEVPVEVGPPPTQLISRDLTEGTGATVAETDTVTVNYIGVACSTGKIFDSTYARGETLAFPLDEVIPGWTQGMTGMKVGGTRLLGIPSELAYGSQARGDAIAPDEALWFVVEVTDAKPAGSG